MEKERAKEYSNYQQIYQQKTKEKKAHYKQLLLLKNYQGCNACKSQEIDAYSSIGVIKIEPKYLFRFFVSETIL